MARPMKPLVRGGGYYPSNRWIPLVYPGGYTTANGGEEPAPPPIEKTVTGNPIHILDALAKPASALSVKLEPAQDLHGYDNPWPAGGGKNKFDKFLVASYGGTLSADGRTMTSASFTSEGNVNMMRGSFSEQLDIAQNDILYLSFDYRLTSGTMKNFFPQIISTDSGYPSFANAIWKNAPAPSATKQRGQFKMKASSSKTTYGIYIQGQVPNGAVLEISNVSLSWEEDYNYSPYSNICPISGWTGAKVTRTGENLYQFPFNVALALTGSGNNRTVVSRQVNQGSIIKLKPNTKYTLSGTLTDAFDKFNRIGLFTSQPEVGSVSNRFLYASNNASLTFTTESNECYALAYSDSDADATIDRNRQLEEGTVTAYEPYQGETYTITFPTSAGTVYGGTLDVTQGKLTADRAMVDLGTLTWSSISGNRKQCTELTNSISKPSSTAEKGNLIAERYANVNASDLFGDSSLIGIGVNIGGYLIARTSGEDVSGKLVYELVTPITIQLTPQQVELLQGENNLFSDGEMTLVYLADGNASDIEALNILLGGRYVNNHGEDEPSDREALDIVLGGKK